MKQVKRPSLLKRGRCKCDQLITQCQLANEKTKGKGVEGHGFVQMKHDLFFLQWNWRQFEPHDGMQSIPHHGNTKESGSLQDLKVGHNAMGHLES